MSDIKRKGLTATINPLTKPNTNYEKTLVYSSFVNTLTFSVVLNINDQAKKEYQPPDDQSGYYGHYVHHFIHLKISSSFVSAHFYLSSCKPVLWRA